MALMLAADKDAVGVVGCSDELAPVVCSGRVHWRGSCGMYVAIAYLETVWILKAGGLIRDLNTAGLWHGEHVMAGHHDIGERRPLTA